MNKQQKMDYINNETTEYAFKYKDKCYKLPLFSRGWWAVTLGSSALSGGSFLVIVYGLAILCQ